MGNYIGAAGAGPTLADVAVKAFDKEKTPSNHQCAICKHNPKSCKDLPFWTMPQPEGFPEWAVECTLFEYNWERHYDLGFAREGRDND